MTALYDGDCGLCGAFVAALAPRASGVRFVAFQSLDDAQLRALGVTAEQCARALQVVGGRKPLAGAAAVNALLRASRHRLAPLCALADALPPLLWIESLCYRIFAANRLTASRLLRLRACRLSDAG